MVDETPIEEPSDQRTMTKQYSIGLASDVELIGPGHARITRGASGLLSVTALAADHERLQIRSDDDSIEVGFRGGRIRARSPEGQIGYELAVPILSELTLKNGLTAEAEDIEARDLDIEVGSGSRLTLTNLRASELEAEISGGSSLTVTGAVVRQKIELVEKSTYDASGLESEEADIDATGESEATLRVTRKLKARAERGASISYAGDRVDLEVRTKNGGVFRQVTG